MAFSPEFRSTVLPSAHSSFDAGLLVLPIDLWAEFTSYLEPTDVLTLLLASQETLKRLMNGGIVRFVATVPISSYPRFLCHSTSIRHLSLMLPRRDMFLRQMRNRDGEIVVSLPRNVTSLHLQFFGAFDLLKKEISHLAHLRHLTIATERLRGLAEVMKILPIGLESLRLVADNLTTPFIQLPRYLTRLTIKPPQWQEYKSGYLMDKVLEQNILPSTLIEFKYKGWSNLTSACFIHLPRGMQRLHLQLGSLYGISAHGTPLSPPNRLADQSVLSDLPRTLVFVKLVLMSSPSDWPTDGLPDALIHSRQYVSQDPHRPSGSQSYFFSVHSSTQEWNRLTSRRGYFDEHQPPTRMSLPLNGRSVEGGLTEDFGIIHHCIHTLPPSLTKLAIVGLALSTNFSTILQVLLRRCPLLRFLQVAGALITDPQIIGLFPRSVETLHIKPGLHLKKLDLSLLPPKLKALTIPGIVLLSNQAIESLPKSLTYLRLHGSIILDRFLLERLLTRLPMIYALTESNNMHTQSQSALESYRWSSYRLRALAMDRPQVNKSYPITSVPFSKLFVNYNYPKEAMKAESFGALDRSPYGLHLWLTLSCLLVNLIWIYLLIKIFSNFFLSNGYLQSSMLEEVLFRHFFIIYIVLVWDSGSIKLFPSRTVHLTIGRLLQNPHFRKLHNLWVIVCEWIPD